MLDPVWSNFDTHVHVERRDKWGSHMYKVLVIIGVSVSNALVVMQFDWERGNWTFMISFSIISTFLSWNIVDLSVSTLCFYVLYGFVGFKPLPTRNFSHGIPDDPNPHPHPHPNPNPHLADDGQHVLHAAAHTAEHHVLAVEVRQGVERDEELRRVGGRGRGRG